MCVCMYVLSLHNKKRGLMVNVRVQSNNTLTVLLHNTWPFICTY